MENITIGYLSWKRHDIFNQTLLSHKTNGLFDCILPKNRLIYFQEINEIDIDVANKYDCNYIGSKENVGILNAFIELVENCKTDYFIFCENDFFLLQSQNTGFDIKLSLSDMINILQNDDLAQVKLSNSKKPGFIYIRNIINNEWFQQDQHDFKYKAESLSWVKYPFQFYKNLQSIKYNYEWIKFNSLDQNWSNHIYGCNTKYLKEIVVPILKHNRDYNKKLDIKYQGLEDTLNLIGNIPELDKNEKIIDLIETHKKRNIYSGGGNFYHVKL